ncbi:hypothetical protein [Sorangium sp. So ce1389]
MPSSSPLVTDLVPPHRYLLARRIERAAAVLRDTDQLALLEASPESEPG